MAPLGPFEPHTRLAVGASGGADSTALALLAHGWAGARGGSCTALIVDHGLRAESAAESADARERLAAVGIAARIVTLALRRGTALAERARDARLAALEAACAEAGVLHLLLAHHAADQAETLAMRMLRGSHADGLAGMAALAETQRVRILRPLLAVPPVRLRQTLIAAGMDWTEDPSNRDPAAQRSRLRALRRDADGTGPATLAAVATTRLRGAARLAAERARADWLGRHVTLHPEGYAELDALPEDPASLAAVLRVVAGAPRPPPLAAVRRFLDRGGPGTLGGVLIRRARAGWLLVRETAAIRGADDVSPGSVWDGRFRLLADAAGDRGALPSLVRRALPAGRAVLWSPKLPLAGAGFVVTPM